MESVLFKQNVVEKDVLKNDIKKLLSFEFEKAFQLPDFIIDILSAETTNETKKALKKIEDQIGFTEVEILDNIKLLHFFLSKLTPDEDSYKDTPQVLVADLLDMGVLEKEKSSEFKKILTKIKGIAETYYYEIQLKKDYSRGCFPTLKSFTSTVDYRVIFDQTYKNEELDTYIPKYLKMLPIASIRLRFSEDSNVDAVSFQMTPTHLNWVINNLLALKKEIDESQSKVIFNKGEIKK